MSEPIDPDRAFTAVAPAPPVSDDTRTFLAASRAPATVRAYRSDVRDFEAWCLDHGRDPMPASAELVADYISDLAATGRSAATITRRLSSISQAHQMARLESPTQTQLVRMTAAGIRRTISTAPRQARPIVVEELRLMLDALPDGLRGARDRALLLVGFAGAFRRSELVALVVEDVQRRPEGLLIELRRSKTDQEGAGRTVAIVHGRSPQTDPATALDEWLGEAGITSGPLFREVDRAGRVGAAALSDRAVTRIVKGAAERIGIDPQQVSGHSLRAGLATSAAAAGAPERAIMNTTGHRSTAMVRRYIRQGSAFVESASRYLLVL